MDFIDCTQSQNYVKPMVDTPASFQHIHYIPTIFSCPDNIHELIEDTTKGGLTIFWELFTVIPCAPRKLKR